ncbi:MAG: GNAT family N-acetyltransferase [Ignavibacteriales bacterium]|nr:GNAT family N-acetyltransferase [Ignavibacteriales bacterium]
MKVPVGHYESEDEQAVVELWNRCLPRDEISLNSFHRKIILDSNFDEEGCFVAVAKKEVVGFLLSIRRRYPYFELGLEPGKGWITVFFVHPEWRRRGIATSLLNSAEQFLTGVGVREIYVSDYTPNYFIPGVDLDAYSEAHQFLKSRQYQKVQSVYGMGRSLMDFSIPETMAKRFHELEQSGYRVEVFSPKFTVKVLEFLREHYPGDLFRTALERLHENPECDEILVALRDGEVVGFSHFLDERFGPFGIGKEYLGRGLGPMLYYRTVDQMRKKGRRNLWLAWTTGRAKDFYHKVGLKVIRRHEIMKKPLD